MFILSTLYRISPRLSIVDPPVCCEFVYRHYTLHRRSSAPTHGLLKENTDVPLLLKFRMMLRPPLVLLGLYLILKSHWD